MKCSSTLESYKFTSEPSERLRCLICYDLAEIPLQHECGKVFCKACIDKNGNKPCPNCRSSSKNFFIDRRCAQEIADLQVKCGNEENGCEWVGTISAVESHIRSCEFALLPCPNNCTSVGKMLKEKIKSHLAVCPNREFLCDYCGEKGTYSSIVEDHYKICQRKQVQCGQCNATMERSKIEEHMKASCEYTVSPCKYESIGCKVKMMRKERQMHETEDSHLDVALDKLSLLTDEMATLKYGESFAFKLSGFRKLKDSRTMYSSGPFYSCQRYRMQVLVDCNGSQLAEGTHLSVFIEILKGRYDSELQWPFSGTVTFLLLNQLADASHAKRLIAIQASRYNAMVGSVVGIPHFLPYSELSENATSDVKYLIEDTLYFRVHVDCHNSYRPWLTVGNIHSTAMEVAQAVKQIKNQEMFTIKLTNFSKNSSFLYKFFVDPGYTAAIAVISDDMNLSITGVVTKKPFGHSLEMFSGTIKVELLNQLEDCNHHSRCLKDPTTSSGTDSLTVRCSNFIPIAALHFNEGQKTQYLSNGCLFFRVNINTDTEVERPWLESKAEFKRYYIVTGNKN